MQRRDGVPCIGRDGELEQIGRLLAGRESLVTLLGPAGVGKTRLATEILAARRGPAWLANLADARGTEGVADAVARALGVTVDATADAAARLGTVLDDRGELLLVLDNCEHVAAEVASLVRIWRDAAPDALFLATSREPLRLEGEVQVPVAPLPLGDARRLLLERARRVRGGSALDRADSAVLDQLLDRLDRLPLAIELAASRLSTLSADQVLTRLADRFALLVSDRRDASPRQASLHAAIAISWELLGERERAALAACSVFHGGITVEAATALLGDEAADLLQLFCDASLVQPFDDTGGRRRFALFESVRDFAALELTRSGGREAAETRHAEMFVGRAEMIIAATGAVESLDDERWFAAERANLLAATNLQHHPELALRACLALDAHLRASGPPQLHRAGAPLLARP
jgi:predicted ATPase